jgi:hypothetical protein
MRRSPKPWGEALWERVERTLERVEDYLEGEDDPDAVALASDVHGIRREMTAENARRAAGGARAAQEDANG